MNMHECKRKLQSAMEIYMSAEWNNAIEEAARRATLAYLETVIDDPKINRDEVTEKAKHIETQILKLKKHVPEQ
jgi:hypothetical protein